MATISKLIDQISLSSNSFKAHHSEGDTITYSIDWESMTTDESLAGVARAAFALAPLTGVLSLAIQPTASMHGMFEFDALATDTAGAADRAEVKVYVVSSLNRVVFIFVNTLTHVEEHADFVSVPTTRRACAQYFFG
ncbi:hypothetical protein EVAR_48938_1 [Eumeta japonica]|uniref:Uncharacterized protein n=1 Tax=Eumeta variegata TaxID=151549 RepID=A0A4C1YXD2_EUMVA|nr:hypothetical protein EVAR_48938_1 [Eumeta japonica]